MYEDIIVDGFTNKDKSQALLMSEAKTFGYNNIVKFTKLIERRIEKNKQLPNFVFVDIKKARAILESDGNNYKNKKKLLIRYIDGGFGNVVFKIFNNETILIRPNTKIELCRLQGFPDDYCDILSRNKAASLLGDGWTLPIITHIFKYIK